MNDTRIPSLLHDLVHHAERIRDEYALAGLQVRTDSRVQDAILWNFVVIGEVVARLGEDFHHQHPEISWRAVVDHRNLIAHGYDMLNWDRLIEVIEGEIPILIEQATKILRSYGSSPQM